MENQEKESLTEVLKVFKDGMTEFNEAMRLREEFAVRIGRRTTQIIRFSLLGMLMLGGVMFTLIFVLLSQMFAIKDSMIAMDGYMKKMDINFLSVAENVKDMNLAVIEMNKSMLQMKVDMSSMSRNMRDMNNSIVLMENNINSMSSNMANMSYQITNLNGYVGSMGYNVNRMTAPMKMFPFP